MEYEKIKQLINDMQDSKLTSMDIEFPDGTKIKMKKDIMQQITNNKITSSNGNADSTMESIEIKNSEMIHSKDKNKENIEEGNIVKSPMVGTFYIKSSPNADPYVKIGKTVKKQNTLCIIEAMKLMNEIESEFDGEVAQIYVKDGDTVEYGTPLFRIK